jgi:hypothetical protein
MLHDRRILKKHPNSSGRRMVRVPGEPVREMFFMQNVLMDKGLCGRL